MFTLVSLPRAVLNLLFFSKNQVWDDPFIVYYPTILIFFLSFAFLFAFYFASFFSH